MRHRPFLSCAVLLGGLLHGLVCIAESAGVIATDVPANDPMYRELRLGAALGLLNGPLYGQAPLSRAEAYRLMRTTVGARPDADRGVTESVAYRLARVRMSLGGTDAAWRQGVYPPSFRALPDERLMVLGSTVQRGKSAVRYLDNGYAHRQGLSVENDASVYADLKHFALDFSGRFRANGDGLNFNFTRLSLRTGFSNVRLIVGKEPLAWGPEEHGGIILSTNARPVNQLRVESEKPFSMFRARALTFTASVFAGKLDDPDRADFPDPNLAGMRFTWQPTRWLAVGASRTVLFGGDGNPFHWSFGSILDLLLGRNENRTGDDGIANDTDQKGSVDVNVYLWPVLRHVPVVKGGRFYFQYAGEDSPQRGSPLPSAPARTWGLELVGLGVLGRVEWTGLADDKNLWYWQQVYTDGYTHRGVVMGHPAGGDSEALSVDLEIPLGESWGMVIPSWERQTHGFFANPGTPPGQTVPPILHSVQDIFFLTLEKTMGPFPGKLMVQGRWSTESGDVERNGPLEAWGVSVGWRR